MHGPRNTKEHCTTANLFKDVSIRSLAHAQTVRPLRTDEKESSIKCCQPGIIRDICLKRTVYMATS